MSGGHFNYDQSKIGYIADEIQILIDNNDIETGCNFSKETIEQMKTGVATLRIAEVYAQRIDWLVSGDDCEDSFHSRLDDDLANLIEQQQGTNFKKEINNG